TAAISGRSVAARFLIAWPDRRSVRRREHCNPENDPAPDVGGPGKTTVCIDTVHFVQYCSSHKQGAIPALSRNPAPLAALRARRGACRFLIAFGMQVCCGNSISTPPPNAG